MQKEDIVEYEQESLAFKTISKLEPASLNKLENKKEKIRQPRTDGKQKIKLIVTKPKMTLHLIEDPVTYQKCQSEKSSHATLSKHRMKNSSKAYYKLNLPL